MRTKRSVPAGIALLLGVVAILALLIPALHAPRSSADPTTPPWEPDTNSQAPYGTLVFYDSSGNVVTSGSSLDHLFDYASGSSSADPGATKATMYFAAPNHANPTGAWASIQASGSTPFSGQTFPGTVAAAETAGDPVVTLTDTDADLNAQLGALSLDSTANYADIIQVRLKDSGPGGISSGENYWSADIAYNQTASPIPVDGVSVPANGWAEIYPTAATTPTTTTTTTTTGGSTTTTTTTDGSGTTTTTTTGATTTTTTAGAAATSTTVTSDTTPSSVVGQQVTYTATVAATGSGAGTPTGTVTFNDGGTAITGCSSLALTNGTATCQQSPSTAGTHAITAVYSNTDGKFSGSTSAAFSQIVDAAVTSVTVTSSQNPASVGQMVTFTATVTVTSPGSGTPTGTVDFSDGTGNPASSCTKVALTSGAATCAVTYTAVPAAQVSSSALGDHASAAAPADQVSATYSGDANFAGSKTASALAQTVQASASLPGAPGGVQATAGDGQVTLTWTSPTTNGSSVTGYNVFQGTSAGGEATTAVNSAAINGTTYTVTGLTNGTKYYFTVEAVSAAGSSPPSTEVSATPTASSGTGSTTTSTTTATTAAIVSTPAIASSTDQASPAAASQQSGSLPFTGFQTTAVVTAALLMVGAGVFLVSLTRNRKKVRRQL